MQSQYLWRALRLALAIYRITDRFPEQEALIGLLRKTANEIVGDLTGGDFERAKKQIEILLNYFKIAQAQNWVKMTNWSILDLEYSKLKQEFIFSVETDEAEKKEEVREISNIVSHNIRIKKDRASAKKTTDTGSLLKRQKMILEEINDKNAVKISDLIPLFKDQVSERTLRNDLQFLLKNGFIEKRGFNKTVSYLKR